MSDELPDGICSVLVERLPNHIAVVTLNRPEVRNAINPAITSELGHVVQALDAAGDVWVIVLTGAGDKAFCAGADLTTVASGQLDDLWTDDAGFAGFVFAKRTKPWIAAVNGAALAGGLEMALACDMIVADERSTFGLPEVRVGLVAIAGGAFRLPRVIPPAIAFEMIATGQSIGAQRAFSLGLVNSVAPAGDSVTIALELATRIAGNAPIPVRESLAIARRTSDLTESELVRMSDEAWSRLSKTEDFAEGPRAFLEKRSPIWLGR